MQVGIDVMCMHTSFGGCGFFGFGDMANPIGRGGREGGRETMTFTASTCRRRNKNRTMDYSPWSERDIWLFLKIAISPKLEWRHPSKLVCMHNTLTSTCMNFLSQF